MTTPTAATTAAEQAALAHAAQQAVIRDAVFDLVMSLWDAAPMTSLEDWLFWWFGEGRDGIYGAIGMGQELMAAEAHDYIQEALRVQGVRAVVPRIDPTRFAGTASDGTSLEELLDQIAWRAIYEDKERTEDGEPSGMAQTLTPSFDLLQRIVFQQVTDAGREADQVAIVGAEVEEITQAPADARDLTGPVEGEPEPFRKSDRAEVERRLAENKRKRGTSPIGWIRLLTPPSCGRCAVLAGKWYGWNEGFRRHDNCDCRHVPALEVDGKDMLTDPREYFNSLDREEQDDYFGLGNAEAIRNGADVSQVMNASTSGTTYTVEGRTFTRAGTTRRGYYGQTEPGRKKILRPTPAQIYRDAKGDRQEAVRLLRRFGYIVN